MIAKPRIHRHIVFLDPLPRIVTAVRAVVQTLDDVVVGTSVATGLDNAVRRLHDITGSGVMPAIIAPRNVMPAAPVRDDLRVRLGDPLATSMAALHAVLTRLRARARLPIIVPHLFVDDPADIAAELANYPSMGGVLIAKTADITAVNSALDHDAVVAMLRTHLVDPLPGIHRLDHLVHPRAVSRIEG